MPRLSRVPHAPSALLGLGNLRGQAVPILSLSHMMGADSLAARRVIVIDAGEPIGIAVDSVAQVVANDDVPADHRIDIHALIAENMSGQVVRKTRGQIVTPRREETSSADRLSLVSFAVGTQEFALPLAAVLEVIRLPSDIALVPHSDEAVVGSTLLREALLPLLSLAALLGLPPSEIGTRSRIVVVAIGQHRVGLVVDAMRGILQVPEADIDPIPQVLSRGGAEARIQAICRIAGEKRLVSVLAADQLLRDDITARLLKSSAEDRQDMAVEKADGGSEQFLFFRIGAEEFGLPLGSVEEVVSLPSKLTPLPRAPAFVQGVMNLRGQVIPVIDQAKRFSGAASTGVKRRVVVVRLGDMQAGFIVDAASEILRVPLDALRDAPDLGGEGTKVFDRVANLPDQEKIVLIISPRELLDRAERDLLASIAKQDATAGP